MYSQRRIALIGVIVGIGLISAGCFGSGQASIAVKNTVSAVVDKWASGIEGENTGMIRSSIASQITYTSKEADGTGASVTLNRDDYVDMISSGWDVLSEEKMEVAGRSITVNGNTATVTGSYVREQRGDYTNTLYRDTANVEITLNKSNDIWYITKFSFTNYATKEV